MTHVIMINPNIFGENLRKRDHRSDGITIVAEKEMYEITGRSVADKKSVGLSVQNRKKGKK